MHPALQNRLVRELRLRDISTPDVANVYAAEFMAIDSNAISMIEDKNHVIGFGGLHLKKINGKEVINLGYIFTPDVLGKRYATEFVNGVMVLTVLPENVIEIMARTHPENIASIKVLEKT